MMIMTGAVYRDLLGHSMSFFVELVKRKALPISCLEGTLLAARVWVAEWRKKARGLNIEYKVFTLFLLSECPQNRDPLLTSPENRPSVFDQVGRVSGV